VTRPGIVTGLVREARLIAGAARRLPANARPGLFSAGGDWRRARAGAATLIEDGAKALVSFGVAGGLADGLRAGDVILASEVVMAGQPAIATTAHWREALSARLGESVRCHCGPIATVEDAITTAEAKCRVAGRSGAIAVDMESYGVALAACDAGVPLAVIRAVSDPAGRAVPAAAAAAVGADGRIHPGRLVGGLVRRPGDIAGMWRVGRDGQAAFRSLRRVAVRIVPFGFCLALETGEEIRHR